MITKLDELRAALAVDKYGLDDVLIQQPQLFHAVASEYAMSVSRVDLLKDQLKRLEGDLGLAIRQDKDTQGQKYTEAVILAGVASDTNRVMLFEELVAAQGECAQWQALRDAFLQRSYAIKDLVSLFTNEYYINNAMKSPKAAEAQNIHRRAEIQQAREQKVGRPQLKTNGA